MRNNLNSRRNICCLLLWLFILSVLPVSAAVPVRAAVSFDAEAGDMYSDDGHVINPTAAQANLEKEIQSNLVEGWPEGPAITAGSAILMDADTGILLYAKNIHDRMYPASTTKLLTALIAAENLDLHDTVTFSETAVNSVPPDGSNAGMDIGQTITVEQCLYATLVGSANECANALAEKTAGSVEAFAQLMNEKAESLGCVDSHFTNANGLYDDNHYTSAYDLCLIGKAFFANEICQVIGNTGRYHFEATPTQPDDFWLINKHALVSQEYSYDGILGGKTGYTSQSRETLVTGCYRSGMRLVCVVMKEDDPAQFLDTMTLFDYGFDYFRLMNIADNDTVHRVSLPAFFESGKDLMGSSVPALSIYPESSAVVPAGASFDDLSCEIGDNNELVYSFGGQVTGRAALIPASKILSGTQTESGTQAESGTGGGTAVSPAPSGEAHNSADLSGLPSGQAQVPAALQNNPQDEAEKDGGFTAFIPLEKILALIKPVTDFYVQKGLNGIVYINVRSFTATLIAALAIILLLHLIGRFLRAFSFAVPSARRRRRRAKPLAVRTSKDSRRTPREGRYRRLPKYTFEEYSGDYSHLKRDRRFDRSPDEFSDIDLLDYPGEENGEDDLYEQYDQDSFAGDDQFEDWDFYSDEE